MNISQESHYYKIDIDTKSRIRHHEPEHRVYDKVNQWRHFQPKTSKRTNHKGI